MSILDEVKDLEAQLAALEGQEKKADEEPVQDDKKPDAEEPDVEPEKEDPAPKEDEKKVEEPKEDKEEKAIRANEFYKARREKAALEKRVAELEARLAENSKPSESVTSAKDDAPMTNDELSELLEERRYEKAASEFMSIEADFAKDLPGYEQAVEGYKAAVFNSLRVLNPSKPRHELVRDTQREILNRAGDFYRRGLNPVEELYNQAIALGLGGQEKKESAPVEKKPTVDHDKLAKNRERNAGTAGIRGAGGGGEMTLDVAAGLSVAEISRLPAAVRKNLGID